MIAVRELPTIYCRDIDDEFMATRHEPFNIYTYLGITYDDTYISFDMEIYLNNGYELHEEDILHNDLVNFLREHLPPEYKDAEKILIYCD